MELKLEQVLGDDNREDALEYFFKVLSLAVDFKLQTNVRQKVQTPEELKRSLVCALDDQGQSLHQILEEFRLEVLPNCTNFGSPNFMGFPDSGNSVAGIAASLLSSLLQQNLINQSVCAPSATFIELAVLQWLRRTVGYSDCSKNATPEAGGVILPGGTSSNTIAMMLAREHKDPRTMSRGVECPQSFKIVVPKGIGHYSIKSAQRWLGCGNHLLEVDTENFRYNLDALEEVLKCNSEDIMAIVAYAGDSRTMTVDNLDAIVELRNKLAPRAWLHADACHGFSLGFSRRLKSMISGIDQFDSISMDPHKVMLIPYTISALLVRDPEALKGIATESDLIMKEDYAFGQMTPFVGSKAWISLKLWFMMKNYGWDGLEEIVEKRYEAAIRFMGLIKERDELTPINEVNINAVAFMYTGHNKLKIEAANIATERIHHQLLQDGRFHLHQFTIPDPGIFERNAIINPLRFMSGNPLLTERHMVEVIERVCTIGQAVEYDLV